MDECGRAAEFVYAECDDQFIEFQGGDGMWLFVNEELAIDLAGLDNTAEPQVLELDRLGLEDGATYPVYLFFAQRRRSSGSEFRLRTNLALSTDRFMPSVSAQYD